MFQFKLPDLGEGIHEGQVVSVLVKEGDTIAAYQPMLEIETDKASVEIPSPAAGVVKKLYAEPGQMVKVGELLVEIDDGAAETGGKPAAASEALKTAEAPRAAVEPAPAVPAAEAARAIESGAVATLAAPVRRDGPIPAAPAVRKLARELNVDLALVDPSGPRGRVVREDVERFSMGHRAAGATAGRASTSTLPIEIPAPDLPDFTQHGEVRREQATQIRKTIARQMTRAWLSVPRVTHCDDADVDDLERQRKRYNSDLKPGEPRITMTAIVLKAVAAALRSHPMLNCSYDPSSGQIVYKEYVHIGVAVDTPRGLVVPVLRDVDRKRLPEIALALAELGEKARAVKFNIADLRGATFTISNVGTLGGSFVTAMVNYPEVGILALGRATKQAVVRDDQVVPRLVLPLSLSFDHRIVDGADGARFTRDVINSLENPLRLISL